MADHNGIAKQFVDYYYQTFDSNRNALGALYKDVSMLTFEGQPFQGVQAISEKLVSLPFSRVQHKVSTIDAQPSNPQVAGAMSVLVTGALLVDDEQRPMNFTQSFQLIPDGSTYFVYNDVFRLNLG